MEPHCINEELITLKERKTIEDNLNGHTVQLGRILQMGKNHCHEDRFKSALINKDSHIPVLCGQKKDHKHHDPEDPPKMRPVAGASEANNFCLSYILSSIVIAISDTIDDELKTVCKDC